jgi:Ala-tRNA(Pro) deacylase
MLPFSRPTKGGGIRCTTQEIAAPTPIPGKQLAKTIIVKLDGKMAMAVLLASHRADLDLLNEVSGARKTTSKSREVPFRR